MTIETLVTAQELALRTTHYDAHILFVEGLPWAFTDDETGELLGSGASSWIGESESALGATVGQRTVLPGLRMPRALRESLDPKTGLLTTQQVSIRLVDYEGILADLFASEGKAFSLLGENIPPGSTALGIATTIIGGTTINARGRHIGLERIGPAGERGYFSPFPFTLLGRHHAINLYGDGDEGPRPIPISVDPLDFMRRKIAIYRVMRRNLPPLTGRSAWPLWEDQYDALGVLWWGELSDRGTIAGNREWDLRASGAASWVSKSLNSNAPSWKPIASAPISLYAGQNSIAIHFHHNAFIPATDLSTGLRSDVISLSGDGDTWRAEIATHLAAVVSGATSDYGGTAVSAWQQSACGFLEDGSFWIRRVANDAPGAVQGAVGCIITMHETLWRSLGFDPTLQATTGFPEEETQIRFRLYEVGSSLPQVESVNDVVPGDLYWSAHFSTVALGVQSVINSSWFQGDDNYGHPRYWRPVNAGDPLILQGPTDVPQTLRLQIDQPYLEASRTVQWVTDGHLARYFAIRGKRAVGVPAGPGVVIDQTGHAVDYGEMEADDYGTVVRCEWQSAGYGAILEDGGHPAVDITRYEDPRLFGVPFAPIEGEWSAVNTTEGVGLEIAPLFTVGYGDGSLGRAIECWYQIMVSTGTAAGWVGVESTDPAFLFGLNSHTGVSVYWCGDTMVADQALGIPSALVASPDDTVDEWDRVPGGVDGALSRIGLAYVGTVKSADVLASIMRPRALSWSLAGGRYGVVMLAPFHPGLAEVTITEESLAPHPSDPDSAIPGQDLRAVGQLDKTKLAYRHNPIAGDMALEKVYRSRDREAQARRGDLEIDLKDDGLVPQEWSVPGVGSWEHSFRELWEIDRAEFFARRHFLVTGLRLHRIAGQTVRVGTRVRLTNPWPVNPSATATSGYGLTDASGIVIDWQYIPDDRQYVVNVLVFAGQFTGIDLFMPLGSVASYSGAAVTLAAEDEAAGLSGASRFDRPSWASGNPASVRFLQHDRTGWVLSAPYTIVSVAGNVVTLSGSLTASDAYRDRDVYMIMSDVAQQTGRWPATYGSTIVLANLQHPGGQGSPLDP